jgi:hypothetical protein
MRRTREAFMKRTTVLALALLFAVTARADVAQKPADEPLLFVAEMTGRNVAPAAVDTAAAARATGLLVGSRFIVHGSFTALSSALRDIAKTPDDPGVHLHPGAAGETTKYFFGLKVRLNADERSGIFFGETTLTDAQRAMLLASRMYIDIHTVKNGPGEVRDQWRPLAAEKAQAILARSADHAKAAVVAGGPCH